MSFGQAVSSPVKKEGRWNTHDKLNKKNDCEYRKREKIMKRSLTDQLASKIQGSSYPDDRMELTITSCRAKHPHFPLCSNQLATFNNEVI